MTNKHYAFVDRKCEKCKGTGIVFKNLNGVQCPECHGTGMIGSYEEVPAIDINRIRFVSGLARQLRKNREKRKIGMDDLAKLFGWSLVHLSDIETGRVQPTEAERQQIQEWIERG